MAFDPVTLEQFKSFFPRDFPFQPPLPDPQTDPPTVVDTSKYVQDSDIEKAFAEAKYNFNDSFCSDQAEYIMLFSYLTAHYLVTDLRAASTGLEGSFTWNASSQGVGSVSQSFAIPNDIANDPTFSWLTKTNYGAKYLMLVYPMLSGGFGTVPGRTQP